MKKFLSSILKFFGKIFKIIYKILDLIIITPISKILYFISNSLSTKKGGGLDKFLNNPNTLIYISLICALVIFYAVDKKLLNLTETEAVVISNQPIIAEYNEEAYVVEGLPETADIVLMGTKDNLYLAQQLSEFHKLTLDLTDVSVGTQKVDIKYNNPLGDAVGAKVDPSRVTVVVHHKVGETRTITTDILNTDKLNSTLIVSNVELEKNEVIIKSYKEKLATVASVKAIVDVNALNATKADKYTLDNVKLVAYDEKGTEINDIEIVPGTLTATVTITSPSKVVPVKVVPAGEVASGSGIKTITPSVKNVTLYGEENILDSIKELKVEIDVAGLNSDKTYQETIVKPAGVRSMSDTNITIKVTMDKETNKEFKDIPITFENLDTSKYKALAGNADSTKVDVTVKGVSTILNKLDPSTIKAQVDLSNLPVGTHKVPVMVSGEDERLTYTSRTTVVEVIITKK